jgi:hypothetical protein
MHAAPKAHIMRALPNLLAIPITPSSLLDGRAPIAATLNARLATEVLERQPYHVAIAGLRIAGRDIVATPGYADLNAIVFVK